jgi:DnaK suppressor protein
MKKSKKAAAAKPVAKKTAAKAKPSVVAKKAAPVAAKAKVPAKAAAPSPAAPATASDEQRKVKLSQADATKYKKLLLDLRDHLIDGVNFLASDNLKRSNREASGELSGYSLHMADAGTDNFDREFALSLVSNEQEGLYEIEEALKRLEQGVYGVCDLCDKLIIKERLEAVPFARRCVQCQSLAEREGRGNSRATASFTETGDDEGGEGEDAED